MKRKMKKILSGLLCVAVALMPAARRATDVEEEAKKAYELLFKVMRLRTGRRDRQSMDNRRL